MSPFYVNTCVSRNDTLSALEGEINSEGSAYLYRMHIFSIEFMVTV